MLCSQPSSPNLELLHYFQGSLSIYIWVGGNRFDYYCKLLFFIRKENKYTQVSQI